MQKVIFLPIMLQVKVAFHSTVHLINQTEEKIPPDTEKGLKKLTFKQNLLIHHSNNSLQVRDKILSFLLHCESKK